MNDSYIQAFLNSPTIQQINKLLLMWFILGSDVNRLEESAKKERSQNSFFRRQYVRAASALIEGFTSMMKQSALLYPEAFSPEEVLLLQEQELYLKENGKASVRDRFIPIERNIRFAFAAYAQAHHAAFVLDCSRSDWQDLKRLFAIRDRITHPKNHEELSIFDDELRCIKRAIDFVSKNDSEVQKTIQRESWLRFGMPEELFENWIVWQTERCKVDFGSKEWDALWKKFNKEVDEYFGEKKSNGNG